MASGRIDGNTNNPNIKAWIDWSSTPDVANNQSTVTCSYYLRNNSGSYLGNSTSWTLKYKNTDGSGEQTAATVSQTENGLNGQTVKQWTRSFTVSHNSDGTKQIKIACTGGMEQAKIGSGPITLDTIEREAKFVSITVPGSSTPVKNLAFGSSAVITIDKPNASFGAICTMSMVTSGATQYSTVMFANTTVSTWTLPSSWESYLASDENSRKITATLKTYTDNTYTTQVGTEKTYTINGVRPGTVPTETTLPSYLYKTDVPAFETGVKVDSMTGGGLTGTVMISADDVVSYSISGSTESGSIPLGDTIAQTFTLTYDSTDYSFAPVDTIGAKVVVKAYNIAPGQAISWLPFGVWYVNEVEKSDQSSLVTLSGIDAMSACFNDAFSDLSNNYPRNLYDIAEEIAASYGLTISTPYFKNYDVEYEAMPEWPEDATKRDIISYIAACAGGIARIGYDGRLQIASLRYGIANHSISLDRYTEFVSKEGNRFEFNAIKVVDDNNNESWYTYDDSIESNANNTIQLSSNPLLTSGIMSSILTTYTTDERGNHFDSKLTYVGGSLSFLGSLQVMCGDEIRLYREDSTTIPTQILATQVDVSFDAGGLTSEISCDMPAIYNEGTTGYSSQTQVFNSDGTINAKAISGSVLDYRTGTVSGVGTSMQSVSFSSEMKGLPFVMVTQNGGTPSAAKVTGTSATGFNIQAANNGCSFKYMAIYFSGVDADAE